MIAVMSEPRTPKAWTDEDQILFRNLVTFREAVGLTQEQAALFSGVSIDNIRRYEQERSKPHLNMIRALAQTYGRTIAEFFEAAPSPTPGAVPTEKLFRLHPGAKLSDTARREITDIISRETTKRQLPSRTTSVAPGTKKKTANRKG